MQLQMAFKCMEAGYIKAAVTCQAYFLAAAKRQIKSPTSNIDWRSPDLPRFCIFGAL